MQIGYFKNVVVIN